MSYPTTLVSIVALLCASAFALRIPPRDLSWCVSTYIVAQCVVHFIGWLGLQRKNAATPYYLAFFVIGYGVVLILAAIVTVRMTATYSHTFRAFIYASSLLAALVISESVLLRLDEIYSHNIPFATFVSIAQAAWLFACGFSIILSAISPAKPAMQVAAYVLGLYWIGYSLFLFAFPLGIIRAFGTWNKLNNYIPAMLSIAAFGWLAFQFWSLQAEGSRQAVSTHFTPAAIAAEGNQ